MNQNEIAYFLDRNAYGFYTSINNCSYIFCEDASLASDDDLCFYRRASAFIGG
ncbi:MAG TPA: hypothetical protein VIO87_02565 [Methylotenera sp.]